MVQEWSDKYSLGIQDIDAQHRRFFDAARRLYDEVLNCTGEESVEDSLAFLRKYAEEHFACEEAYMEKHAYPHLEAHQQLHADFMERLGDLVEDYDIYGAPSQAMADQILELTQGWLVEHIMDEDTQYARHIAAK